MMRQSSFTRRRSKWRAILLGMLVATVFGGLYVTVFPEQLRWLLAGDAASQGSNHNGALPEDQLLGSNADTNGDKSGDDTRLIVSDSLKRSENRAPVIGRFGDDALPLGVGPIEGEGGVGFRRQVKSLGVWYPVFDLSKARTKAGKELQGGDDDVDPDTVKLAEIPLAIASPPPDPALEGESITHQLAAIGGKAPYRWQMVENGGGGEVLLDEASGVLSARSSEAEVIPVVVSVTDSAGDLASVSYALKFMPTELLDIATTELPSLSVGEVASVSIHGVGGVQPYRWTISTDAPGLQCVETTGQLTGSTNKAGDYLVNVILEDAQGTRTSANLRLNVTEGLEITTDRLLPFAAPDTHYEVKLEVTGGTVPYTWKSQHALPFGLLMHDDGVLQGDLGKVEGVREIEIAVEDGRGLRALKTFRLSVVRTLIVQASRDCAGVAWYPQAIRKALGLTPSSYSVIRQGPGGSVEVYQGTGRDFVDGDLATGGHYTYLLAAYDTGGQAYQVGSQSILVLPQTLSKGSAGVTADPFADDVVSFSPLSSGGYGANRLPINVTGPPQGGNTGRPASQASEVVSLHASNRGGGQITLAFRDNIIRDGPGLDFTVFENVFFVGNDPNQRFMEPAMVDVALFEGEWWRFPVKVAPPPKWSETETRRPTYYAFGLAGVNATTGEDPSDPRRSGGDSFDLSALGPSAPSWVRFVRITSTGDDVTRDNQGQLVQHTMDFGAVSGGGSSGFDLDAVSAVEKR